MQSLSEIVHQIKAAANIASKTSGDSEAKLHELVSPIWVRFLKEKRIGLNFQIRDELTLANGRPDTVFNKLILEYKKPNTIKPDNNKNRKLISQVQGYILDLAKKERFSKERLLGVAFDGNYFLFMRYAKRWISQEPIPVNESSLEFFLKNLEKLTSKAALIPENLIRDFAVGRESRNEVAVDCIKAFYHELNQHGNETDTKEHAFFEQWKIQFAEVHGSLEEKKIDKLTLFTSYGFSKHEQKDFNVHAFFFALDSYFALLMKLLSYQVVGYYTFSKLTGLPLREWGSLPKDELQKKCDELEDGAIFRSIGIRNFLEGDLFSWYTTAWNENIYNAVQQIIKHLNNYDPETMEIAPDETRDILKKLYQYLVPKQIRHDLGEYYTPDWLAERCLNQLNYNGQLNFRVLDPGCGSGTFLILAIKRAKEYAQKNKVENSDALHKILYNIQGFDLNPLAVISARSNYMMAVADLLKFKKGEITIPIYLCDSIHPPQAWKAKEMTLFKEKIPYEVKTSVGTFLFPDCIVSRQRIQQMANIMEDCVKSKKSSEGFLTKVKNGLKLSSVEFEESELYLSETYEKLIELERKGINGVWARIIKNAFAPLFVGNFDLIAGNPPWVNWEALPQGYRDDTKPLWVDYGLFSLSGTEARYGGGKKDISMLMTYVAIDKYLKNEGKLCFVITQTLFKTLGAGDGFRRFKLGEKGPPFKIEQLDDMVNLKPFEGATNRTAVVTAIKGAQTIYPLTYLVWKKLFKGSISMDFTFDEVLQKTKRSILKAQPIDDKNLRSPWISLRPKALSATRKVIGISLYQAFEGANSGGANGIYWVNIFPSKNNFIEIENLYNIGKKKIKATRAEVETKLIYPLLRGRDVSRWHAKPSAWQIVAQDPKKRKGYETDWMENNCPKTKAYFVNFEKELRARAAFKKYQEKSPFWSQYNIGPYTFAPYKVVWKEQSNHFQCAVISKSKAGRDDKVVVPDHKLMLVPFENEDEAYYVAALLNSSICRLIVIGYVVSTQQSTHILRNINIPKFNPKSSIHTDLTQLSKLCHHKTSSRINVAELEEQIDDLACKLWNLTADELMDIRVSLKEFQ